MRWTQRRMKSMMILGAASLVLSFALGESADQAPSRIYGVGDRAAYKYPDRLEFVRLPEGMKVVPVEPLRHRIERDGKEARPQQVRPSKVLRFGRPFVFLTAQPPSPHMLICTDMLKGTYPAGVGDFCGVIALDGSTVYKFPVTQKVPGQLLRPIGIDPDGNYAAVFLGERVEGEDSPAIGKPREILVWEFPSKFRREAGPWKEGKPSNPAEAMAEVMLRYRARPRK